MAIKPNFAVWPGLLLLAGCWPAAATAAVTAVTVGLVPVVIYDLSIYASWLEAARLHSLIHMAGNMSLPGLAARFGLAPLGMILAVALCLAAAAWAWRARPPMRLVSDVALAVSLLAAPLAWEGYAVLLVPMLLTRPWGLTLRVAASLLTFPVYAAMRLLLDERWAYLTLGSASNVALLLIALVLITEARTAVVSIPRVLVARPL